MSVAFFGIAICASASVKAESDLSYTVVAGDTLSGLASKYLNRVSDYRIVQKRNGIANPYRIPVGTILKFPRSILKFRPSSARLASVKGQVTTSIGGKAAPAVSGLLLVEGQELVTAGGAFAALTLEDGSRISVPSNSEMKLVRLRRYVLDSALDYDFRVERGSARSKVVPLKSKNDRYQVRTPRAVSAVRGTDFQTRFDEKANRDFAEVDEGALAVNVPSGPEQSLPAGNGLTVNADGSFITEALLPPIEIAGAGRLQNNPAVRFILPKTDNAIRVSIARDAAFQDQVADQIATDGNADFDNLEDGNYFLRARAISANGLEGLPITYAFKRRLNAISGSAGQGTDGWLFKWNSEGAGKIRYNFQLYRDSTDNVAFVDEAGLETLQVILSDLPDGEYFWRVGAVQYVDGETNTNWTPFEKIIVSAN